MTLICRTIEPLREIRTTEMSLEGQLVDKKSLRAVTGKTADWQELAKDCIAFANAQGGRLLIGVEDDDEMPQPTQRIDPALPPLLAYRVMRFYRTIACLSGGPSQSLRPGSMQHNEINMFSIALSITRR